MIDDNNITIIQSIFLSISVSIASKSVLHIFLSKYLLEISLRRKYYLIFTLQIRKLHNQFKVVLNRKSVARIQNHV